MEKILKGKRFFTFEKGLVCFTGILLVMLVVFSCNNIIAIKEGGSLIIALPGTRATTASRFTIELTGTSGFTKSETLAGGTTAQFDDLVPDTYSISVKGRDDAGTLVLSGTATATVIAGETVTVPVTLQNLLGSLTVDFVGAESDSVVEYIVTLSGPNESKETKKVDARTSIQFEGLIPGDYIVSVEGKNGDVVVLAGTSSTVTVEAGKTKSVTVELQKLLGSLTIDFSESATSSATEFKVELNIGDTLFKSKDVSGVTSVQFDDLVPGTYDIVVEGTNEAGAVIFYGTSSAAVSAGEESATVELMKGASDFASLEAAVAAGGKVYIFENIDVSSGLTVGTTVEILPAYQNVTLTNNSSENLFTVDTNGNLTIGGGEYTITLDGNTLSHHAIYMKNTGKATLSRNAVITNCGTVGVKFNNYQTTAYFYLEGGSITGNNGSGVEISSGSEFHMNSGIIEKNKATDGGGVYLFDGGTFYLNGGSITGNNAGTESATGNGGGVYISSGSLYMNGGSITGNTSTGSGGGVYSTRPIIMTGGLIEGNSTSGSGNGVFYNGGNNEFKMSGSAVVAPDNDVYLNRTKTISITGELTGDSPVATITPYTGGYAEGTQVLSAGDGVVLTEDIVSKFAVTPASDGSQWTIDTSGNLQQDGAQ